MGTGTGTGTGTKTWNEWYDFKISEKVFGKLYDFKISKTPVDPKYLDEKKTYFNRRRGVNTSFYEAKIPEILISRNKLNVVWSSQAFIDAFGVRTRVYYNQSGWDMKMPKGAEIISGSIAIQRYDNMLRDDAAEKENQLDRQRILSNPTSIPVKLADKYTKTELLLTPTAVALYKWNDVTRDLAIRAFDTFEKTYPHFVGRFSANMKTGNPDDGAENQRFKIYGILPQNKEGVFQHILEITKSGDFDSLISGIGTGGYGENYYIGTANDWKEAIMSSDGIEDYFRKNHQYKK